ncbi:MAG TPA: ABC transporter permease [Terracidiphilus sp.]|nr:ABC transporter permease [Terracidiphilus sp.]
MAWLQRLLARAQLERDLDKELRFHFEAQVAEKMRSGIPESEARRLTRHEFGGIDQIKEDCRESRGTLWIESLVQDVRYGFRQLRNAPGFTLAAVTTLALGIGATTAIFTLVHGILERSLPVADPSSLYRVGDQGTCCYYGAGFERDDGDFDLFPYDLYLNLKRSSPEFEQLAAVEADGSTQSVRWGLSLSRPMRSEFVSGNYFATLGVGVYAGRPLTENDDKTSSAPVLVLSYAAWQSEFAGNPAVVGSSVYVETHPFTVIGIAPPGLFGDRIADRPPDFWMPLSNEPAINGEGTSLWPEGDDDTAWLYILGRVRPQTSIPALQSKLSAALRQWMFAHVKFTAHGGAAAIPRQHVVLAPAGGGIQRLQQKTGQALRMLMLLSSVVLLIACANFANLLLARGTSRRAELSVRMALGAARSRIMRQILTQSVLLSLIGGAAGLAVAYALSRMILLLAFPHARNMPVHATPSPVVLGFAFLVSLLTGVGFGTVPAWFSSQAKAVEAFRTANRSTGDRSSVPQRALVVVQVALSVVLLSGAFLMGRSLANLEHQNFGIATANRYVLRFDPEGAGYTLERLPALYREIEDRFSALPSATSVSLARYTPLDGNAWGTCIVQQGHSAPGPEDNCFSSWVRVSRRFLQTIGVPIVRGRDFSAQDTQNSPPVVLVNQSFAKTFFPSQDPVGKRFGVVSPKNSGSFEIAGVFADFKMNDPRHEAGPLFLRPLTQQYLGYTDPEAISSEKSSMFVRSIIVEFSRPQSDAENLLRHVMAEIDPNLNVLYFSSYDSQVAANFDQDRLVARLTSMFGVLALTLASVGLYGVISFFVTRRTTEIGIRMAMGASRSGIVSMVMRGAFWPILAGIALGIPAALYAGHLSAGLLYGVKDDNPLAYLAAVIALAASAALACFIPARRAASIEPMEALREQ